MKTIHAIAKNVLKPLGFRKKAGNFWKVENGVYKLISFQGSQFGKYFFINIGIHPVGLPTIHLDRMSFLEQPKEYECFLRQRIESLLSVQAAKYMADGEFYINDETTPENLEIVLTDIQNWIDKWGVISRFAHIARKRFNSLTSETPFLQDKGFWMGKAYCSTKISEHDKAQKYLKKFLAIEVKDFNFEEVEEYISSVVNGTILNHS